jgi:hypothetical protein
MPSLVRSSSASQLSRSSRRIIRRLGNAVLVVALVGASTTTAHAAWTAVLTPPPMSGGVGSLALLTDGSVLVGDKFQGWYKLTPDNTGKYEAGTWSATGAIASSHVARDQLPSTMLQDGRYMILGGEHISGPDKATMEIYDPVTNTWTPGPDMPAPVGDTATSILPGGSFLVSSVSSNQEFIYSPSSNSWSPQVAPGKPLGTCPVGLGIFGCSGDEKGWTLLQNGKVLDAFTTWSVYTPANDVWTAQAALPSGISLTGSTFEGLEIGPASLLYSGKVVQFGAANAGTPGQTAIYDPATTSWTSGPTPPDHFQFGDTPAAVMPNGHVLCTTSPNTPGGGPQSSYYEYDPVANSFGTALSPPPFGLTSAALFLVLPTGQVLVAPTTGGLNWAVYTSTGAPMNSWRPTITSISGPVAGEYTLTGTQFNGLTTGATFGDDHNMATNYPIVSLSDVSGHTYYARTYGFDQMAPLPVSIHSQSSCKFTLPVTLPNETPNGTYSVHVSANGVPDTGHTTFVSFSGPHVTQISGPTSVPLGATQVWNVTMSAPTPGPNSTIVNLSSSDTRVATIPASVAVTPGQSTASFLIVSRGFGRAIISAGTTDAHFKPATREFGWTVSSVVENSNAPFTQTVTISNVAPFGGVTVNLSANTTQVSLPSSVTVPQGATSATFGVTTAVNPGLAVTYASLINSSQWGYLIGGFSFADTRWSWLNLLTWF